MDAKAIESSGQIAVTKGGWSAANDPPKVLDPSSSAIKVEDDSVTLSKFAKGSTKTNPGNNADFQRKLSFAKNNQVVIKLVDPQTQNVVRQTPPEEQLRLREAIRNAAEKFELDNI